MSSKKERNDIIDKIFKERSRRLHAQAEKEKAVSEEKEKKNEEYAKQLRLERIELLKEKQGLTDGESTGVTEEKKEYTFWQKVGAFFYCNKIYIVLGGCVAAIGAFLISDLVSKPRPDFTLMVLSCTDGLDMSCEALEGIIDEYIDDKNGNGEILSSAYYMPVVYDPPEETDEEGNVVNAESAGEDDKASEKAEAEENSNIPERTQDAYTQAASTTKLFALMQDGDTIMVISDSEADMFLVPDDTLEDLEALYPGNEHVKGHGFYLSGTKFAEETGFEGEIPEDVYIGLRKVQKGARYIDKMQENYDEAKKVLDALVERFS